MSNTEKQIVVVEGTVFYPFLSQPNTKGKFPSNKFQYELGRLDEANVAKLNEAGLSNRIRETAAFDPKTGEPVPEESNKGTYISPKSKLRTGQYGDIFTVYEADGQTPMSEERLRDMGNGSKVRAKIVSYVNTFDGSRCAGIGDMIVLDYVQYDRPEQIDDSDQAAIDAEFRAGLGEMKRAVSNNTADDWGTVDATA